MKTFLTWIILLIPFIGIAQNDNNCVLLAGGPAPDDEAGVYSRSVDEDFLATFEPVTFTIFFWGINNDDVSNTPTINEATVQEAITRINNDFNPFNIFFRLKGFDNQSFNSSEHHIGADLEEIGSYAKQHGFFAPNTFNVYIPENHGPGGGEARFNSTICAVERDNFQDYTLTHELAHDFFIFHTREFFNTPECEHVTRDPNDSNYNALTAGDRIADTAASPRYNLATIDQELDEVNCLYIGDLTDCEGTPYEIFQEDILNFMSAFAFSCRSIFSTGQKIRMHESILADVNDVFTKAKITFIPDPYFEQALIDQGIDSDQTLNGEVFTADIYTLTDLDISNQNIQDITGIQDFTALQKLDISFNNDLTAISLLRNIFLEELMANNTSLENLIITTNEQLRLLSVRQNNLTNLDVSNNVLLETLDISNPSLGTLPRNEITDLDLTTNTALASIIAFNSNITNLTIQNGNNSIITEFSTLENPNLTCIQVDDATTANNREQPYDNWLTDFQTFFSEDCSLNNEDAFLSSFKIFPNPVQEEITIIPPQEVQLLKIEVFDISGKRVLLQESDFNRVRVFTLPKGVFFLRVDTQNSSIVRRFIKG
ncbi:T9SS type A sorting domain-containing protein [Dokdonia sp.]|uniref:T9SS type A sorting domain-containing protein n=1 Tax=Dokdonia sp. TaxID=2024995 RepID=UPI003266F9F5